MTSPEFLFCECCAEEGVKTIPQTALFYGQAVQYKMCPFCIEWHKKYMTVQYLMNVMVNRTGEYA